MRLGHLVASRYRGSITPTGEEPSTIGSAIYVWGGGRATEIVGMGVEKAENTALPVPTLMPNSGGFSDLAMGIEQQFFMEPAGGENLIYMTGNNLYGGLGLGDQQDRHSPTLIAPLSTDALLTRPDPALPVPPVTISQLGFHNNFSGVVLANGYAYAWGGAGQIGINASGPGAAVQRTKWRPQRMEHPPDPVTGALKPVVNALEMRTGRGYSMIRMKDGTLWRAGESSWGTGYNKYVEEETKFKTFPKPGDPSKKAIKKFLCTEENQLALLEDGTIYMTGCNSHGQLLTGYTEGEETAPVWSSTKTKGYGLGDLVRETGELGKIYRNTGKENKAKPSTLTNWEVLRTGVPQRTATEVGALMREIVMPEKVIDIAMCDWTCFALLESGAVRAWGYNDRGQLGNGSVVEALYAEAKPWKIVYTETNLTPALVKTNEEGNPSFGSASSGKEVTQIAAAGGLPQVQVQGCPNVHVLTKDGSVWGWGGNDACATGTGEPKHVNVPLAMKLPNITNCIKIACDESHGAAMVTGVPSPTRAPLEGIPSATDRSITLKLLPMGDAISEWEAKFRRLEHEPTLPITAKVTAGSDIIEIIEGGEPVTEWGGEGEIRAHLTISDLEQEATKYKPNCMGLNTTITGRVAGGNGKRWKLSAPVNTAAIVGAKKTEPAKKEEEERYTAAIAVPIELMIGGDNEPWHNIKIPYGVSGSSASYTSTWIPSNSEGKPEQQITFLDSFIASLLLPNLGSSEWPDGLTWKRARSMLEIQVNASKAPEPQHWLNWGVTVQPLTGGAKGLPNEVPIQDEPPWITTGPVIVGGGPSKASIYQKISGVLKPPAGYAPGRPGTWRVNNVPVATDPTTGAPIGLTVTYQWWRRTEKEKGTNLAIPGATNPTYEPTAADEGYLLRLTERAENAVGISQPIPPHQTKGSATTRLVEPYTSPGA